MLVNVAPGLHKAFDIASLFKCIFIRKVLHVIKDITA